MYERHRGDDRVVNEVTKWSKANEQNLKSLSTKKAREIGAKDILRFIGG
jgi:hypothetical protein